MAAAVMASKTLILQNPYLHHPRLPQTPSFPANLRPLNLRPLPKSRYTIASYSLQSPAIKPASNGVQSTIADSTKTISSILAVAASLSSLTLTTILNWSSKIKSLYIIPTPEDIASLQSLQENVICSVSPLFFAAIRGRPSGALNTPLTVVAAGLSKWLDIYSGVLLVRVLLSWFPNIPWDRQPLSAIRDLCDPYLNLFRNIIPPIFDTLDVSPLLAFAVLGVLGSILRNSRGF